jgi:ribonuclease VapC
MMVVDPSALTAIFFMEPDAPKYLQALQNAPYLCMSAANFLEIAILIDNAEMPEQMLDLDLFLAEAGVEIVPVTARQARLAREAYHRFGKGNHSAKLNFGDCFAYALSTERDLPLLYKGDDFTRTDLRSAL